MYNILYMAMDISQYSQQMDNLNIASGSYGWYMETRRKEGLNWAELDNAHLLITKLSRALNSSLRHHVIWGPL